MATLPGRNDDNRGNQRKSGETIQNKLKVLQLINKTTNKIVASNLRNRFRHGNFTERKIEECHEITAIIKVLNIGRDDKQDVIKDDIFSGKDDICSGIQVELGK